MKSRPASAVPRIAQALVPREMMSWALVSVALAAVEGGVIGVLVKNLYQGVAAALWVNVAVAMVSGAPAFANIFSFAFAIYAQGRDKVRLLTRLLALFSLSVAMIALAPLSAPGLLILAAGMVLARIFWAATITVRSAVWRANFPRQVRARITGQMTTLSSGVIALTSLALGFLLDISPSSAELAAGTATTAAFRWTWLITALAGLAAAFIYRQAKVRGHRAMLRREREADFGVSLRQRLSQFRSVLRDDHDFRGYMIGMFIFGSGNLMLLAPLIVLMNESFALSRFSQVMITSTVPLVALALSVPLWARILDGSHIITYRTRQSWSFVIAILFFALAAQFQIDWLLWLGGATLGVAYAGGNLGWNLGHNDFSNDHRATLYMGIHVTLTGIRGLLMPPLGVLFYEFLKREDVGLGDYALFLPLSLSLLGALWFVRLHRQRQARLAQEAA